MSSAYFAPLVTLPDVITAPGRYRTRAGDIALIERVSSAHDFGCTGAYANGIREGWHKSGRLFATSTSRHDIIARMTEEPQP